MSVFTNTSQESLGHEHEFMQAQLKKNQTQPSSTVVSHSTWQLHNFFMSELYSCGDHRYAFTPIATFQSQYLLQPLTSDQNYSSLVMKYVDWL